MQLWRVSNASMACVLGPLDSVCRGQALSNRDIQVTCSAGLEAVKRKGVLELWQAHSYLGLAEVMVERGLSHRQMEPITIAEWCI